MGALEDEPPQFGGGGFAGIGILRGTGHAINGGMARGEVQLQIAHISHAQRVRQSVGKLGEPLGHLLGAFEEELARRKTEAIGIGNQLARADAAENVVRFDVIGVEVVDVVAGDARHAQAIGQVGQLRVDHSLFGQVVILQFEEEAIRPEDFQIGLGDLLGFFAILTDQGLWNLAAQAGAGAKQAVGELSQDRLVDSGSIVEPLQIGDAHQAKQVAVALQILGQQQEMVAGLLHAATFLDPPIARGHVDLTADDRLDAGSDGGGVELDGPEHVAVVGQRHGGHVHLLGSLHQIVDARRPIEQAVVRMNVQVDETRVIHRRGDSVAPDAVGSFPCAS